MSTEALGGLPRTPDSAEAFWVFARRLKGQQPQKRSFYIDRLAYVLCCINADGLDDQGVCAFGASYSLLRRPRRTNCRVSRSFEHARLVHNQLSATLPHIRKGSMPCPAVMWATRSWVAASHGEPHPRAGKVF